MRNFSIVRLGLSLLLFFPFAQVSAQVTRLPYLQVLTPTSTEVRWNTSSIDTGIVNYELSTDALTNTAVGEMIPESPDESSISNYPNPFSLATNISYTLQQPGNVKIEVYDLLGRKLATLVDEVKQQGEHTVQWVARDENGSNLAGGMYIAQICTDRTERVSRLMLMR